ncbi:ribosome alternative rescue factor ArfA [Pseudoalteromonas sp. ACER1]|uniref:Alternative ribosome rescue factor ArfA n=1 Tax=Pseudoalteromonas lipolytica TaxID=570156 RepID=A0A0N8HK63_9GAMM|nr:MULTISPECIES: alternative ribosome rescue factor ArfA [Pseudoalteromonas]MED5512887.1 alternative ribosome rescue factor ArfA [Pseudomonadota bacterium]KPM83000.1 alternative ribosome-rescue factor [Pseudoalteromonas lipolytica]MBC7008078.1 ribosome alternative rescue factor ArfA [Pseudoalteromonas sp. BZK2]MCF2846284.1 ribosome alternative rescue factor ArfA [Pseudoalteromonas sp. PAST1]MCF2917569.1 ribosome alternative rescue factor ArfA [Pseudoalteromonas sp. Cn5-37]|tara:strand:- start:186 stop:377 length:192 start_codon:yes stop_codon:yes gene_type:complete
MSKKKQRAQGQVDTGRGVINDNVYAAMVTSKLFTAKVEKPKKGKGAYQRKAKHAGRESYLIAA